MMQLSLKATGTLIEHMCWKNKSKSIKHNSNIIFQKRFKCKDMIFFLQFLYVIVLSPPGNPAEESDWFEGFADVVHFYFLREQRQKLDSWHLISNTLQSKQLQSYTICST